MSSETKAHIALFFAALFYGANYSIAKIVMDDDYIQPLGFILIRVGSALIFFRIFHALFIKERVDRKDLPLFFLCGIFGVAINQMFFFVGLDYTTPINASLIMTTTPILVLLISSFVIDDRFTFQKFWGIALGATGAIVLIAYGKELSFKQEQLRGDLIVLINATSYAFYLVLAKRLMVKYHPITVIKWIFTFGIIFVFPFGIHDFMDIKWSSFSTIIWLSVMYVVVFTTFGTYLLNSYALQYVNPSVVSIYIYLQPVMATLVALALTKDQLNAVKIIAGLLIFAGVFLVSRPTKHLNNK